MLERIGGMTPDLLLVDTTGIDNPGFTQSEIKMLSEFDRIIRANPNKRVIVSLFSTNIRAIARLCEIANFADRPVDYYGTSMAFSFEEFGLARNDQSKFNGKPVVFVTGCQAEPFSVLPRLARHNKRHPIFLHQGDDIVIVAARHIPSSAKRIDEMLGLLRFMIGSDAVITAADRPNLHVSGHGSFGDIAAAIAAVKPTYVAGIHNSHAFRARISDAISAAKLSSEVVPLVAKNGETIEI
jgi:ribonuclease J